MLTISIINAYILMLTNTIHTHIYMYMYIYTIMRMLWSWTNPALTRNGDTSGGYYPRPLGWVELAGMTREGRLILAGRCVCYIDVMLLYIL